MSTRTNQARHAEASTASEAGMAQAAHTASRLEAEVSRRTK
jgi:hypothetical protein